VIANSFTAISRPQASGTLHAENPTRYVGYTTFERSRGHPVVDDDGRQHQNLLGTKIEIKVYPGKSFSSIKQLKTKFILGEKFIYAQVSVHAIWEKYYF
jgi:hypothetical protein